MLVPPTSLLLLLHEPPTTRPVYDIPPVISFSPRWPRLRRIAGQLSYRRRTAPHPGSLPDHCATPLRAHEDSSPSRDELTA